MKKFRYLFIAALFSLSAVFTACNNDDEENIEIISPVAGDYVGAENCDGEEWEYEVLVYNTSMGQNEVWIHNLYDFGFDVRGTVSDMNINVAPQEVQIGPAPYTVSGNGSVANKTLTFTFTVTDSLGAATTCTFTGVSD